MPQKSSPQIRTWGTRFDTLPTSPSVSPPAQEAATFDPKFLVKVDLPPKKREEKMPHDASVFVGSLPSTVDQAELTRLLSEHLSEHTEVKNIKVVRDTKGGVCAFVQCEDAVSAASLIHTLHTSPPKYFLGRTLRYEPARAFRTLLISYRTPVQYIPIHNANMQTTSETHQNRNNQIVELELPYAMRVWKPRNSKFISLLYNAEAVDAENHSGNPSFSSENASLFFQPVVFDGKSIRSLAAFFGRLERFTPYQINETIDGQNKNKESVRTIYPAPHDGPRSACMDTTCWEVKWDYRDDCVSALMTLRRVPHLTVTWAHQPASIGADQRSPHPNSQIPNYGTSYASHVQDTLHSEQPQVTSFLDNTCPDGSNPTSINDVVGDVPAPSDTTESGKAIKSPSSSLQTLPITPPLDAKIVPSPTRVEWSEIDFPPLSEAREGRRLQYGAWGEKRSYDSNPRRSPSLSTSHFTVSHTESDSFGTFDEISGGATEGREGQELDLPLTPGLGKSPITPRTPGSQFPVTPTSANITVQKFPFNNKEHNFHNDAVPTERELDPTTLFVGGLETFGPGAWDEEKVANFFSRFGGLESVKVVRPLHSHAAFAFVKFDNTESPARAVFEEHNRTYEGRTMRVQLRDCNPPRGPWRQGRVRGRFPTSQLTGPRRRTPENSQCANDNPAPQAGNNQDTSNLTQLETFSAPAGDVTEDEVPFSNTDANTPTVKPEHDSGGNQTREHSSDALDQSISSQDVVSQANQYRDWYEDPLPTVVAPPSSSFGSSTLPYSASGGFYTPTPWVHPYAHPVHYPMSYFAYPGYPMPGQQFPFPMSPSFTNPAGSEANGSGGASTQAQWQGMYGSYMPYPPQPTRTPALDQSQTQNLNSRAPLVPTGFIQNEQGTLIAVYQPEALDQYMAGNQNNPTSQASTPTQTVSSWPQYPQPHSFPFSGPPPAVIMSSRPTLPSTTQMGWVPNQGYPPQPPQLPAHTPSTPYTGLGSGYRSNYGDMGRPPNSPSYRRQPNRRDQHGAHSSQGRNNHTRSFASRNSRGNVDGHLRLPQSQFNQNTTDWSQWER